MGDDCMTRVEQDILHVLLKSIFEQGLIPESTYRYAQNQISTSDLGLCGNGDGAILHPRFLHSQSDLKSDC